MKFGIVNNCLVIRVVVKIEVTEFLTFKKSILEPVVGIEPTTL